MSVKRLLLAATAASLLVIGLVPLAHAAKLDAGVCIERHDRLGPQGRLRDTVERPEVDELQGWIAKHPRLAARAATAAATGDTVVIRTWVHVLREDLTVAGGNIPRRWIDDQIAVMNSAFGGDTGGADTGFAFELAGVTRTTNEDWFHMHSQGQDRKMKLALKRGGLRTLNIYTVDHRTLLGYAWLAQDSAKVGVLDGVVVHYQSLPAENSRSTVKATPRCTRSATGSTCSTRSTVAATAATRSTTPRPRPRPRSSAPKAGIRVRMPASTRSRTSWTTPRTTACSSSPPGRRCGCSRPGPRSARRKPLAEIRVQRVDRNDPSLVENVPVDRGDGTHRA